MCTGGLQSNMPCSFPSAFHIFKNLNPLELKSMLLRFLKFFLSCSLNRVIRTSLQLQLRWLIRNHILLWKSFLTHNMSNSTSTSLASELSIKVSAKWSSVNKFLRRQKPFRIHAVKSVKLTSKIICCFFHFNSQGLIRMKMFSCYPRWKILC